MSPRPDYSGGYSYSSYGNPWNEESSFAMDQLGEPMAMFNAEFAFDVLTVIALIGFIVWACLIRNPRGSLKGVLVFQSTWLVSSLMIVIYDCFFLSSATLTQYFRIDWIIQTFFSYLSDCLGFFVFYNLIHGLLDRLIDAGNPYKVVKILHWVVLGIVSALSLACWGLMVAAENYEVYEMRGYYPTGPNLISVNSYVESAQSILYLVVSIEILVWAIFIAVKAGSHRFNSKTPAIALIFGSIFWLLVNLMWTVVQILYGLERGNIFPSYLPLIESVVQFCFIIGLFVGILLCCDSWSKLDGPEDKAAATTLQYPYPTAQNNGHYQAYQPYQAYTQQTQPSPQQQPLQPQQL